MEEPGSFSGSAKLAEARAGTRAEEADVVGDLEAAHGNRRDGAVREHHRIVRCQRLELVGCGGEWQAGDLRDARGDLFREALRRGETGADSRAALGELHQHRQGHLQALDAVLDLLGIAGKLLAERHGRGVLGVRAADLDDVGPRLRLGIEGAVQMLQCREQPTRHLLGTGDVHGGRERIVRRLAHVHVIIGMDRLLRALLTTEHLDAAI